MKNLKKATGVWRGVYCYDPLSQIPKKDPVGFTLILNQGWFGRFSGTVTDDALGMPGIGAVDGYLYFSRIEFYKRMPVSYISTQDGRMLRLSELIIELGRPCRSDIPHPPIFYFGKFLSPTRAQGTWTLEARQIPLGDGTALNTARRNGTWSMERSED